MFIERNHIINSADLGFTLVSLLGGEIDEEYQTTVNNRYPGRYGSFAVGVYNGGGYHAIEENDKKSIEGRFSLRPLPDILPGFQISYHGVYGYGNTAEAPKWTVNQGLLSFENQYYTATVQYYTGIGSSSGIYKIGDSGFGLIGRYDYFKRDIEPKSVSSQRYIAGIAYYFTERSKVLFDYDKLEYKDDVHQGQSIMELVVEINFR